MNNLIRCLLGVCCFCCVSISFGQTTEELTSAYLNQSADRYNLNESDVQDWAITNEHTSEKSNTVHVYGIQKYKGIEIFNASFGLHIVNGDEVLNFDSKFISNIEGRGAGASQIPKIAAINAIQIATKQLGMNYTKAFRIIDNPEGIEQKQLISKSDVSIYDIPAKLMYLQNSEGNLQLVWDISINDSKETDWWSLKLDAETGLILDKENWTIECANINHQHGDDHSSRTISVQELDNDISFRNLTIEETSTSLVGGYNVYPLGIESPNHGVRAILFNPDNFLASPYGWHDTDGSAGPEFTTTQGNNVHAYESGDNSGFSPSGGGSLYFDFPVVFPWSVGTQSEPAAITNLFYWNNSIHDVLYQYGFTEAAGNFQENSYGRGGVAGDYVNARAQISVWCNATFGTPPDGSNPTMNMYIGNSCPFGGASIARDGCFDNLVVVHEYGHGISNRLVGGAANVGCLSNNEQMGEGWSDWYGLMLTMENTHLGTDSRGVGTWLFGQTAAGTGIRAFPYNTDMTVDPRTYDSIMGTGGPHPLGSVWAAMLWEVTWALINTHGFDTNFHNGTGGNNIALHLVTEALKLTVCSPGFVDGRDAILQADQMIYGGANQCLLWQAFAKRGLGFSANQGLSSSRNDGTEAFDVPPACGPPPCPSSLTITIDVPAPGPDHQEAGNDITADNVIFTGAEAVYHAGDDVLMIDGFLAENGSVYRAYIEGCTGIFEKALPAPERERILLTGASESKYSNTTDALETLIISPNPNDGIFNVYTTTALKKGTIQVVDMIGNVVYEEDFEDKKSFTINIQNKPTRIYIVRIVTDKNVLTGELVKY